VNVVVSLNQQLQRYDVDIQQTDKSVNKADIFLLCSWQIFRQIFLSGCQIGNSAALSVKSKHGRFFGSGTERYRKKLELFHLDVQKQTKWYCFKCLIVNS